MSERDYSNNWDDYWRDQAPEHQGIPTQDQSGMPVPGPTAQEPAFVPMGGGTPPPTTTGKTPQQIEQEGRDYDQQHGLIGGYMMNGVWVNGSPSSTMGGGVGGGSFQGGSGGAFAWPSYSAPGLSDPGAFDAGPAFSYKDFVAPTGADVLKDPSFQFRLEQGQKALESSAAGKGILRSGGTMKDLLGYGQNFASQEYGNVYNRAANDYGMNRSNAADIWGKQYGQRQDVYGANVNRSNAANSFNLNNAQFDFSGRQRQAEQEFQDAFNRFAKTGDWYAAGD